MRKFYLENEYNQRYDLQNLQETSFLTSPSGLGLQNSNKYIKIGESFIPDSIQTKQSSFKAKLIFLDPEAYTKFRAFVDYICRSKDLKLIYSVDNINEYKRNVNVSVIDKGERRGATLEISIQFDFKSLYYTNISQNYNLESSDNEFRYPFRWDVMFNDNFSNQIAIVENTGHTEASFKVKIYGYAKNPTIKVYQNDALIHQTRFNIEIDAGETLEFSTLDGDVYTYYSTDTGTTNAFNYMDIQYDNFFKLPIGTSKVVFSEESGLLGGVLFNVYQYYKAV